MQQYIAHICHVMSLGLICTKTRIYKSINLIVITKKIVIQKYMVTNEWSEKWRIFDYKKEMISSNIQHLNKACKHHSAISKVHRVFIFIVGMQFRHICFQGWKERIYFRINLFIEMKCGFQIFMTPSFPIYPLMRYFL